MDAAYLDERLEGFATAVQDLVTWHQRCDDALSRAQVARYQQLSAAVRNTLRGLAQYDDAVEVAPIVKDMQRPFLPNTDGYIGLLQHDVPGQMYVLELFGRRVLKAAEAQMARLSGTPTFQLECGIDTLRQLQPGTHVTDNSIRQEREELETALTDIASRLGAIDMQATSKEVSPHIIKSIQKITLKLLERLSDYQDMEYATIAALPILRDEASYIQNRLHNSPQISLEDVQKTLGLLMCISNELPRSQHANCALQEQVENLFLSQPSLAR